MHSPMAVSVSGITKGFAPGAGPALNRVTFTAEANRITSLVGASGCGKTTTLNRHFEAEGRAKDYAAMQGSGRMALTYQ